MRFRLSKPSPAFVVATAALFVALGGTSYAVSQISGGDVKNGSLTGSDIANGSLTGSDVKNGSLTARDFSAGTLLKGDKGAKGDKGEQGVPGTNGTNGAQGPAGPAGAGRWVLINANGTIEAQSGGFTVAAAYPELPNTAVDPAPSNALRANGNVYINANEDLSDNGIFSSIALQNQVDQNGDTILNGRAPGADNNPEFSGEISSTVCGLAGIVACAPTGTNNSSHFVVSPRNSDGTVTTATTHKRFYVIITGDSSDFVAPVS